MRVKCLAVLAGRADGQRLGREALAAVVEGGDTETVHPPAADGDGRRLPVSDFLHMLQPDAVVEGAVVLAGVEDVAGRGGRGLVGILRVLPAQDGLPVLELDGEGLDRQRLDRVGTAVPGAQVLEDALVDGPGHREAEGRVQAVFHVGEILVREQFQEHGRDGGRPGLAVGAVPRLPPGPVGLELLPDVIHDLRLDVVGEKPSVQAGLAVREFVLVVRQQGVDAQRADDGVVLGDARVAVESEGKVEGNAPAARFRVHARAAGEVGHPLAASREIPRIVVLPVIEHVRVDAVPLHAVQGAFREGGVAGQLAAALDLAHAAAELHGVGAHQAGGRTLVRQAHEAFVALREGESPEIDPGAPGHPLVHVEFAHASQVMDRVHGVGGAVGEGTVGNVDGVLAPFRNHRPPGGGRLRVRLLAGDGLAHQGRAGLERVLVDAVDGLRVGETGPGVAPGAGLLEMPGAAHLAGALAVEGRIVVADDLPALDVPFARRHHAGARILQHRDEEGEDITLGIQVLHGAEGGGPLPFPALGLGFIIAAVALPEGDMPAGKPAGPVLVGPDEGRLGPRVAPPQFRLGRAAVRVQRGHLQEGDFPSFGIDVAQGVGPVGGGEQVQQLLPHPLDVRRPQGIVPEFLAEMEVQRRSPLGDPGQLQGRIHGGPPVEAGPQGVGGGLELPGGLGGKGEACQEQDGGEKELSHHFLCLARTMMRTMAELRRRARASAPKSTGSPDR